MMRKRAGRPLAFWMLSMMLFAVVSLVACRKGGGAGQILLALPTPAVPRYG
jgi:hypothetical protein